jgi:BON domain-containing protein
MDYREDDDRGRRHRDESDYRGSERRDRDQRDYDRRDRSDERGFLERLADELRSWFRDEEARRRPRDERRAAARWGGGERGWGADDEIDRERAREWGYVDPGEAREARSSRGRGAGGERYGSERAATDRRSEPRSGWGDPSAWGPERGMQSPFDRSRWRTLGAGPHAGRGPRGYQRSDERIREDVCDILCAHGDIDASEIEVTVLNGEVTLIGVVRERPEKRMAEDVAEQVSGVREVHNQLRVSPGGSGQEPGRPGDPRFRVA